MSGTLYVVSVPIGNLEDITLRALRILKEVNLIAAEDTRHTRKLLSHYDIHTPMISYFEHNETQRDRTLLQKLESGNSLPYTFLFDSIESNRYLHFLIQ